MRKQDMDYAPMDVAVIGAMDEEVAALLQHMDAGYEERRHIHARYFLGRLCGRNAVVFQSGIGKVNAALATAFVIERFAPAQIVNIGSAGAVDAALSIGDVVISTHALYHDVDVTVLPQCVRGQVPGMPLTFPADARLIELTRQALRQTTHLRGAQGEVGSGDTFISDAAQAAHIRTRFPRMLAVDMEAAAVAHTCHIHGVAFVVIRSISDVVGHDGNKVDFHKFLQHASLRSATVVAHLAAHL